MDYPIRINKYIAQQGWASRREADTLIESGSVLVNGKKAVIGQQIDDNDEVTLKGETKRKVYFACYKGRGIITHSPAEHETDIVTKLTSSSKDHSLDGASPVGRLDKDSEGLIILSNDGRITGPLLNPDSETEKEYEVIVDKQITPAFLRQMEEGVMIEGYKTKPAKAESASARRFLLTITEGKKHQIRRMCAALGYQIDSLKRTRVQNITLGTLKPNQYRVIKGEELNTFLHELSVTK